MKGWACTVATSAHTNNIEDGTTPVFAIPANAAVGDFFDCDQVRFETSLIVDPDDSATGTVSVFYRVLGNP